MCGHLCGSIRLPLSFVGQTLNSRAGHDYTTYVVHPNFSSLSPTKQPLPGSATPAPSSTPPVVTKETEPRNENAQIQVVEEETVEEEEPDVPAIERYGWWVGVRVLGVCVCVCLCVCVCARVRARTGVSSRSLSPSR